MNSEKRIWRKSGNSFFRENNNTGKKRKTVLFLGIGNLITALFSELSGNSSGGADYTVSPHRPVLLQKSA
jgi:hypothetical protein